MAARRPTKRCFPSPPEVPPVCYSCVREGAKTIVMEIWNANEALKIIERERPTVFIAAPAQLAMLLQEQDFDTYDTSSIRVVYCGTSPLSYETVKAGKEKLNALVLNACGSFEGGGVSGTSYLMGNKQGCTPRVSLITAMKSPSSMNKARKYRAERKEN